MFGSRKKIYVSSSLYNMAGNYDERTNYMKYLVLNGVLSGEGSIAETIQSGTLNGPRMNYQSFFRWAANNYPEGMPVGGVFGSSPVDPTLVNPFIPVPPGYTAEAELVNLDSADYWNWAEAYMMEHYPTQIYDDWNADIDEVTNEITIILPDESVETFMPSNYDIHAKYLYARYNEVIPPTNNDPYFVSAGPELGPYEHAGLLPNTNNHYLISEIDETGVNQDRHEIVTVTKTYSDGRPSVTETTRTVIESQTYSRLVQTFERFTNLKVDPLDDTHTIWDVSRIVIWEAPAYDVNLISTNTNTVEIEPGVFETTVTETSQEVWRPSGSQWWGRMEAWEKDNGVRGNSKLFVYRIGDGIPELDALEDTVVPMDGYFPMIPVRTNNKMIDEEPHLTNIFPQAKKAWKRASGGKKIEKLIEQVGDNPDLKDIDYAFMVWGVPLNTITREGKLYIYKFFQKMMEEQTVSLASWNAYLAQAQAYADYLDALSNYFETGSKEQVAPPVAPIAVRSYQPAATTVRTNGQHPETAHYDFRIKWNAITEEIHEGVHTPGARVNAVKLEAGSPVEVTTGVFSKFVDGIVRNTVKHNRMVLYWQETETQYRRMEVIGAQHINKVYGGKSVNINSTDALNDGDDSGFLVPMHYSILKSMPMVWANQLATEGLIIIFNCYVVVKKKWYQTFLGAVLIAFVTMGIGAAFSGAGLAASGGILGTNAAVGAMFGMTGMAGAIAGAAINAIVATVVMAVIQEVAGALGPLGAIFAAIAGIALGGMMSGQFAGGFNFDIFLRADNLLRLTNATINAYSLHVQAKTEDIFAQIRDLGEQYKKQKREIDQLMYELTGFSSGFDPMILTEVLQGSQESRDAFNQRTLMTGSDIAELTHGLIDSFVASSLDLESLKG